MNRHLLLHRIAPIGAALALGGGAGAAIYASATGPGSTTSTVVASVPAQPAAQTVATSTTTLTQLYKDVAPGVVDITVDSGSSAPSFAPGGGQSQAEGSGFVIDTKGDIVTNEHVVDGATSIKVRFQNGKTAKATLVGTDDSTDVAVIKVSTDASLLHPLSLGHLEDRAGRPERRRDRQPVRPPRVDDRRHRQRRQPHDHGAEQLLDLRRDPDRRGDQPRQLRRPAARSRTAR